MPAAPYTRLKITSLKFISLVDRGAQGEISNVALAKRADSGEDELSVCCKVAATDSKLGIVFGWALANTLDGGKTPHVDLQNDHVVGGDDLIKIAAAFAEQGAQSDVMHDDVPDGKILFMLPLSADVIKALGLKSDVEGLAIGMKPSAAAFARYQKGELNAFSIAGTGIRELVKSDGTKCASCDAYGKADSSGNCPTCGKAMKSATDAATTKSVWSTADVDALPDSSFLFVEAGGSKDTSGKTTPRSLRHFPYKDASGKVDLPHLRDAIGRIPQSSLPKDVRDKLQVRAETLLGKQHAKRFQKQAVLTSIVDGHQHSLDLDDPADAWDPDSLTLGYATSEGAQQAHTHAWIYDAEGKITISEDSGHTHTVDAVVPADVMAEAAAREDGETCPRCKRECDDDDSYCPSCGCELNDGTPKAQMSDDDSESGAAVIVIQSRAPQANSSPAEGVSTVKSTQEQNEMADQNDKVRALEAENALLKSMATLTDAQRAHHNKLIAKGVKSNADAFLALTPAQRDTELAEIAKSDPVVYVSKGGKEYRQSHEIEIIAAAKATDAMEELQKRLTDERTELEFSKRGDTTLPNFPVGAKKNLKGRIMKALAGEFKDPAEYAEAERALQAADYAIKDAGVAKGVNPFTDAATGDSPMAKFNAAVADFAKRNNLSLAQAMERGTATDPEIRKLYNEASGGN